MKNIKRLISAICLVVFVLMFAVACGEAQDEKDDNKASITLDNDYSQIAVREEVLIEYTVNNGTEASAEFESDDETVLTVDELGYMTGKKEGTAQVIVRVNLIDGTVLEKTIDVSVGDHTEYKIQFQLAGGKCSVDYGTAKKGESYTLPIPTKDKAEFLGWSMSGVSGYVTEITNITSNVTVRANWLSYYTVTYDLAGGTYDKTSEEVKEGTPIELGTPTKAGNKFLGWSLSKSSTSYITKLGNINANCTIYAQWDPQRIEMSFDLDNGIYNGPKYVTYGSDLELTKAQKSGYEFLGWSLEKGSTNYVTKLNNITEAKTLYANFKASTSNIECIVNNLPIDGLPYDSELQLKWQFEGISTGTVSFSTTDTAILTVSNTGLIKTIKPGVATITLKVKENASLTQTIEIVVYKPGRFEVAYDTVSYVTVNDTIKLDTVYINKSNLEEELAYKSLDTTVATVDNKGVVTGVKEGTAKIRAYVKSNEVLYFDYLVTVVNSNISNALKFVLESHESNIYIQYGLGIGAGSPAYYADIFGSVSKLLYRDLMIDRTYYDKLPSGTKNYGPMTKVEFICVHYTGNMSKGADADNNVSYFNNLGYEASIHFVTGRSDMAKFNGDEYSSYGAYAGLSEKYAGWHASTGRNEAVWDKTGVKVASSDPETPLISTSNGYYTINGKVTTVKVPTPPTGYVLNGSTITVNGKDYPAINQMGLITKTIDGEYYLCRTYWGSQRSPYALCTYGGNTNAIGIESCVDQGNDLMHTWQVTAQLCAKLLEDYNLGFDRVVGHHFFSGKDCPQPLLENDSELWYLFMDQVKAEYRKNTEFKDYEFIFEQISNFGAEGVRTSQSANSKLITYKVTVKHGTETQEVTLGSVMNGSYSK